MTGIQKLFWLVQMGLHVICDDKPHNRYQSCDKKMDDTLSNVKMALAKTALHPLEGMGVSNATVMCLLTMPNAQEDRTGTCLSGPEGEMLKKMLLSIGLDTTKNAYVGYISPWRSPGNRLLTPAEIQECLLLLKKKIERIQPKFLLVFGMSGIRCLWPDKTLSQVRHQSISYMGIPVFATFAPDWLLKHPDDRRSAWEDLKKFKTYLPN